VLSQLLHNLLGYKIQHTMYLLSRGLLSRILRSVSCASQRMPLTTHTALQPLGATLRIITLPFLIPVDKLVLLGGQHHLLLFHYLRYPCGRLSRYPFPNTCFTVTTTGLISDRTLTGVSRLA